jgi:hypothetical protein
MNLTFEKIIELIEDGKYISPKGLTDNSFVFVSNEKWTLRHLEYYNDFKRYLKQKYNLDFSIVGGGKSCSKIILEFEGSDENISRLLMLLYSDTKLYELATQFELKYAMRVSNSESLSFENRTIHKTAPYNVHNIHNIYVDTKNNSVMENQSFSNNGSINGSNVNGSIKSSTLKNNLDLNDEMHNAITSIEKKIRELQEDRELDIEQTNVLLGYVNDLREELEKPTPKKGYVDLIMNKLSQIDTLASLTERVLSCIPV